MNDNFQSFYINDLQKNLINNNITQKLYINGDSAGNAPPISKSQTLMILSQLEKNICKIYEANGNKGTGFLCKFHIEINLIYSLF